jgi:DNA repair exonuclease SbcCD nuclease subunit
MRFLHAADIHLGNRQYDNAERMADFSRAFRDMLRDALDARVELVLLAGDLFHKRDVEPRTFVQAAMLFERLKAQGIPVLAIQGNHEGSAYREAFTWLDGLAELGLVRVLSAAYHDGQMVVAPYDDGVKAGAYYDIGDVRVYGLRYAGASTARVVADLSDALARMEGPRPAYSILMLHAGLEGILDQYAGTLSRENLEALRPHVDYVALGHIHKPFCQDDWLYNPGSLENNSVDEAQWSERGYYLVDVHPGATPCHTATLYNSRRRRVLRHAFAVDPYETPEALYDALLRDLEGLPRRDDRPVFELRLTGVLNMNRNDLDMRRIEDLAVGQVAPLVIQLQDLTASNQYEIRTDQEQPREEIERQVLRELLENDVRRRAQSARWAELALRLKQMALARSHPTEVIGELRAFRSALGEAAGEETPC